MLLKMVESWDGLSSTVALGSGARILGPTGVALFLLVSGCIRSTRPAGGSFAEKPGDKTDGRTGERLV